MNEDDERCMDEGKDPCVGTVEPRMHPHTWKYWPRCTKHYNSWLFQLEGIQRRYGGDVPPPDFDPTFAGETW